MQHNEGFLPCNRDLFITKFAESIEHICRVTYTKFTFNILGNYKVDSLYTILLLRLIYSVQLKIVKL